MKLEEPSREKVIATVERDFAPSDRAAVVEELDHLQDHWVCLPLGHAFNMARIHLSVLKLAAGDLSRLKQLVHSSQDWRDICIAAGGFR